VSWILIIATVCYPNPLLVSTPAVVQMDSFTQPIPPRPTIEARPFKSRAELEAFVLTRVVWGPCSESLMGIAPDGAAWQIERVERKKKVVREVEESDGYAVEWREVRP
jgi:hypothetical protein